LVEILVATAILSIIVGVCAYAFRIATESWSKSEARLARYQNARAALEMMSREISNAVLMAHSVYHIDLAHIPPIDSRFLFVAPVDREGLDLVGLGYRHDSTNRTINRMIQTAPPTDGLWGIGSWVNPVADHIESLRFEFFDGTGTTRPDWDSRIVGAPPTGENGTISATQNRLPRAVKITVIVRDPLHIEPAQIFSTLVFIGAAE
jgi:type II secretory pathway pseudopilin PulG